jgi:hypothetical protein
MQRTSPRMQRQCCGYFLVLVLMLVSGDGVDGRSYQDKVERVCRVRMDSDIFLVIIYSVFWCFQMRLMIRRRSFNWVPQGG